jgi:hypothetical protein
MTFPQNEEETIKLFQFLEPWIGWEIVHLQRKFPDAIIANSHGAELIAEFEFLSANYQIHEHPNEGCDLIVCFRDNWPGAPLPIWALEETLLPERKNVPRLEQRLENAYKNFWDLHHRAENLKQEIRVLKREKENLKELAGHHKKLQCRPTGTISVNGIGAICVQCPEEYERLWYLFELAEYLPDFVAIREWMQTADIPNRSRLDMMLTSEERS